MARATERQPPPLSATLIRIVAAALLLPTLVGVAVFSMIALLPSAPVTDFDPNAELGLRGTIETVIVFGAFFGAAYGPMLIPIAVVWLLIAPRHGTPRLASFLRKRFWFCAFDLHLLFQQSVPSVALVILAGDVQSATSAGKMT